MRNFKNLPLYEKRVGINEIYPGNILYMCTKTQHVEKIKICSHVWWFDNDRGVKGYCFSYIDERGNLRDRFCSDYGVGTRSTGGNALFKHDGDAIVYQINREARLRW